MRKLHSVLFYIGAVAAAMGLAGASAAQTYPVKPIRMIVPYPPGGGTDAISRLVAQRLGESLGQPVLIDNRGGAGGILGTDIAAKSAPDGYTLLMGSVGPSAVVPAVMPKVPYTAADFMPVSLAANSEFLLGVHPSLPVKTVKEFIALARSQPGKLDFGSTGNLGGPHLAGELFKIVAKVNLVHVPYKGGAPQTTALIGGEISLAFLNLPNALPHISTGRLRALGTTGPKRSRLVANVPAIAETLRGYEVAQWYGILVPARTPKNIVSRLHGEIAKLVNTPAAQEQLNKIGFEGASNTPEEFTSLIHAEMDKWARVIKTSGVPIE